MSGCSPTTLSSHVPHETVYTIRNRVFDIAIQHTVRSKLMSAWLVTFDTLVEQFQPGNVVFLELIKSVASWKDEQSHGSTYLNADEIEGTRESIIKWIHSRTSIPYTPSMFSEKYEKTKYQQITKEWLELWDSVVVVLDTRGTLFVNVLVNGLLPSLVPTVCEHIKRQLKRTTRWGPPLKHTTKQPSIRWDPNKQRYTRWDIK